MSLAERPDIREPHQHRGEILPCRGDDFDLTRLLDGNRAQAGADGLFLQLAGGDAGQGPGEPSTWYDQGSASDMTACLPFCDCNGDTTVTERRGPSMVTMNPARSGQTGWEGS